MRSAIQREQVNWPNVFMQDMGLASQIMLILQVFRICAAVIGVLWPPKCEAKWLAKESEVFPTLAKTQASLKCPLMRSFSFT